MRARETVKWFAEKMEENLQQNDYKGGWRNNTIEELYSRLLDETSELQTELNFEDQDMNAIISECADAANFAMMIADIAKKKLDEIKK